MINLITWSQVIKMNYPKLNPNFQNLEKILKFNWSKESQNTLREVTKSVNVISINSDLNKEFYEKFDRGITVNQSNHEELNKGRKIIENLQNDIAKLHGYYRMKMNYQRVEFQKELDNLRKNLSNNRVLWDKLTIAGRNEAVLKEEFSKTQKSLAATEEFISEAEGSDKKFAW